MAPGYELILNWSLKGWH